MSCESNRFQIGAVSVRKVDVDVKISLSTSILTWDPIEDVTITVQSIPNVNPRDVKNFDVVTNRKRLTQET